ncbi:MAG TPA: RNA polymerase sigma factor [Verrucomicrobiae bacterium]|nr:RNA polymerase sigma factor [Verrucomicrobiae bacterium]
MAADIELQSLYDAHAQALFAFLLNFTRDEQDTYDLLQDLFIKLARHPHLLETVQNPRAYLIRLAHNAAVDLIRRRGARHETPAEADEQSIAVFAPSLDPDEATLRAALEQGMSELPPAQRAVVHLKLWEGLTFEEIADTLEIPVNTAASRYRYGLDKLRDRLRPLYDEIQ